jgi:hypothetical protein
VQSEEASDVDVRRRFFPGDSETVSGRDAKPGREEASEP